MKNKNINLTLSLDEVNKVLTALGNLPYSQIYTLIQKVQQQTEEQLPEVQPVLDNQKN